MKITSICSRFKLWHLKRQCRPNLEDIKNEEVEKLAKRLKGDSEKETLTNILEWQDRNIQFWWERWPIGDLLKKLVWVSFLLALFIVLLCKSNFLIIFALLVVFVALFFVSPFYNSVFQILYPFLLLPFVYRITNLASHSHIITPIILIIYHFYVGCLGAIVLIVVYLIIRHNILSEKSKKQTISKFIEVVNDTTRLSLPLEKIVKKYRLAVCRDYAKLTAALLFSIYPNSKVYFFAIPRHVASAVKINGEYYVLDQKLPVLTKNGWQNNWNRKDTEVYVSELKRNSEGIPIYVTFDYHEKINRKSKVEIPKVGTEELTERIANIVGIEQSPQRNEPFEIRLYDYAIYYDDDEITKYSLIRAIKNRFEGELCSNIDKVSKIEINQNKKENGKDLIIKVYFDSEPI